MAGAVRLAAAVVALGHAARRDVADVGQPRGRVPGNGARRPPVLWRVPWSSRPSIPHLGPIVVILWHGHEAAAAADTRARAAVRSRGASRRRWRPTPPVRCSAGRTSPTSWRSERRRSPTVAWGSSAAWRRGPGWPQEIDSSLALLKIHRPYHESDHVLNIAYNALCGGTTLNDIEARRGDRVFLDGIGAESLPDPTTRGLLPALRPRLGDGAPRGDQPSHVYGSGPPSRRPSSPGGGDRRRRLDHLHRR